MKKTVLMLLVVALLSLCCASLAEDQSKTICMTFESEVVGLDTVDSVNAFLSALKFSSLSLEGDTKPHVFSVSYSDGHTSLFCGIERIAIKGEFDSSNGRTYQVDTLAFTADEGMSYDAFIDMWQKMNNDVKFEMCVSGGGSWGSYYIVIYSFDR